MKKDLIELVMILDRSGSMETLRQYAVKGYNQFITQQKKALEDKQVKFTLILFDDQYIKKIDGLDLKNVQEMHQMDFQPRGMTALLDAIGKTIDDLGNRYDQLQQDERPENVIIGIMTDGEQNQSKKYTKDMIKQMITRQEQVYNWTIVFLSSDIKSVQEAVDNYGVSRGISFKATKDGYLGTNSSYTLFSAEIENSVRNKK